MFSADWLELVCSGKWKEKQKGRVKAEEKAKAEAKAKEIDFSHGWSLLQPSGRFLSLLNLSASGNTISSVHKIQPPGHQP